MITEETIELLILGHIAKELKGEIQSDRQINLAKTIMQALRIHAVIRPLPHLKKVKGEAKICCNGQTEGYRCADCGNVV